MSLRTRLTAGTALALALAICAGLAAAYFVVRGQLIGEIDTSLKERLELALRPSGSSAPLPPPSDIRLRPAKLGGAAGYVQFVNRNGKVTLPAAGEHPPPDRRSRRGRSREDAGRSSVTPPSPEPISASTPRGSTTTPRPRSPVR